MIDDGGHKMQQQIGAFKELFKELNHGGVYFCEDTGTSYSRKFGGGHGVADTFVEYIKTMIDHQNNIDGCLYGIHFYPWMIVIEKQSIGTPKKVRSECTQIA